MGFIPVNEPLLNGNEKKYLNECIDTGWISSEGAFVKRLEDEIATYVGRKHGVAVCNGSVALEVAVEALKLCEGDEVIMPTFTIISCAAPLVRKGIVPVLVDSEPLTWNMDVNQIEQKITNKTKAIMVVHIYGLPVNMDVVLSLAEKYNLYIIEDAAEAHGLTYRGKQCGSFGDISIMSFYPNKHITTGEGGMVLVDDDALAERCRSFRNLCFLPEKRFVHEELGYNFRMSNIQAAVGVAQLEKIEEHVSSKKELGRIYTELFKDEDKVYLPIISTEGGNNIYWVFGMVLKKELKSTAVDVMELLAKEGIGTRPFFYPMHMQPVFRKMGLFENQSYPVAEWIADKGFYIPSGLATTKEQMYEVAEKLKAILKEIK